MRRKIYVYPHWVPTESYLKNQNNSTPPHLVVQIWEDEMNDMPTLLSKISTFAFTDMFVCDSVDILDVLDLTDEYDESTFDLVIKDRVIIEFDVNNKNGRIYTKENVMPQFEEKSVIMVGQFGQRDFVQKFETSCYIDPNRIAFSACNFRCDDNCLVADIFVNRSTAAAALHTILTNNDELIAFRPTGNGDVDENGIVVNYTMIGVDAILAGYEDAFTRVKL
jgi:hypothetical protein